jgi:two-component sensor histidine kinase
MQALSMTGTTTLELPRRAGCAGIARMVVTAHGDELSPERLKSALLMVSELVTNAFKHGRGQIRLTVRSEDGGLSAEVGDDGAIDRTQSRDRGGWGLQFVERLSDEWGVDPVHARVWFRLRGATSRPLAG